MLRSLIRLPAATLTLITLLGTSAGSSMADECKSVRGAQEETLVATGCMSPVGLCTVAQMFGHLKGQAIFTAKAITQSPDTPTTGVVFVIGDTTVVNARLGGKRGT